MGYKIYTSYTGPAIANTAYQNNTFDVKFGGEGVSFPHNILVIECDVDGWAVRRLYVPDPDNEGARIPVKPPQGIAEEIGQAILGVKELQTKLAKWRKDAVKRLEKSVPRLETEYKTAAKRLDALKNLPI